MDILSPLLTFAVSVAMPHAVSTFPPDAPEPQAAFFEQGGGVALGERKACRVSVSAFEDPGKKVAFDLKGTGALLAYRWKGSGRPERLSDLDLRLTNIGTFRTYVFPDLVLEGGAAERIAWVPSHVAVTGGPWVKVRVACLKP